MNFKQITLKNASEIESDNGINLDDLVSEVSAEWIHDYIDFKEEYLKSRITSILNAKEYYSLGKGKFQKFEMMSEEDQKKVIAKQKNMEETHRQNIIRLSKYMKGQLAMKFNEDGTIEFVEVV